MTNLISRLLSVDEKPDPLSTRRTAKQVWNLLVAPSKQHGLQEPFVVKLLLTSVPFLLNLGAEAGQWLLALVIGRASYA
jgi:hypothetical protein